MVCTFLSLIFENVNFDIALRTDEKSLSILRLILYEISTMNEASNSMRFGIFSSNFSFRFILSVEVDCACVYCRKMKITILIVWLGLRRLKWWLHRKTVVKILWIFIKLNTQWLNCVHTTKKSEKTRTHNPYQLKQSWQSLCQLLVNNGNGNNKHNHTVS